MVCKDLKDMNILLIYRYSEPLWTLLGTQQTHSHSILRMLPSPFPLADPLACVHFELLLQILVYLLVFKVASSSHPTEVERLCGSQLSYPL